MYFSHVIFLVLFILFLLFILWIAIKCGSTEFQCNEPKTCIAKSSVCDGVADCKDGSDERNCSGKKFNFS